ncbi:unnamed protein product, partial [Pylaiella littoralis]
LPVVLLEVFRGQVVAARSALELPPIITNQGRPLTFSHPCPTVSIPAPSGESSFPDSKLHSSLGTSILLEVRCSFQFTNNSNGGEPETQQLHAGNSPVVAPRAFSPDLAPKVQRGGVICIQVVAIQRLHRAVRSALAL